MGATIEAPSVRSNLSHVLTDQAGTVLSVDDRFCEMLGRERADIIGRCAVSFTNASEQARHRSIIKQMVRTLQPIVVRKHYRNADGALVYVKNCASVISDGLGALKLVATIELLSDSKLPSAAERNLRVAKRLAKECHLLETAFGPDMANRQWRLALNCYVLEMEGRPTRMLDLCASVQLANAAGNFAIMAMVSSGAFEIDAPRMSLDASSIRLSSVFFQAIEQHLLQFDT